MTRRNVLPELQIRQFRRRAMWVLGTFAVGMAALCLRAVELQVVDNAFLAAAGEARHLRRAQVSAHRGTITDRHGQPLAVSTPVDSVWVHPGDLAQSIERLPELAHAAGVDAATLARQISANGHRQFLYVRRHMRPDEAAGVMALGIPGVHVQREYRRYYPAGEVTGHLLGFTDVDDRGQEGLELSFNHWLQGEPGVKRVMQDRLGRVIEDIESVQTARPGRDLQLSLDLRIQYLAYRELKAAVNRHDAAGGSAVVLDVTTGEVLAVVNQPAYNPNDRSQFTAARYRNRALTDILEPGSTFKPLVIAAALESGRYQWDSVVNTSPGRMQVGNRTISDTQDLGRIDLTTILARSSNVGAAQVSMDLEPAALWGVLDGFGVGRLSESGFPGESAGLLQHYSLWRPIGQATMAYGYGVSMTALQLAQAYSVLAADGRRLPASLLAVDEPPRGEQVLNPHVANTVLQMLEAVTLPPGTGTRAAVQGYRVAGKTGTSQKLERGGYVNNRHVAVFAGVAPVSDPRLAVVVIVDEPRTGGYFGGEVAAPVFSRIVSDALRLLAVPPDGLRDDQIPELLQAGVPRE